MSIMKSATSVLTVALLGCGQIAAAHYVEPDPVGLQGSTNPYVYVGNNPVSFVDPLGLTAEDVNIINEYITQHFSDISRRGGYEYGAPNPGAAASTSPWSGVTTLPTSLRCAKLSLNDFEQLFEAMLHESMHSTDPTWQAAWDSLWGNNNLTANHKAIFNRVTYETLYGHKLKPKGPMWGTPTSFVPDPVALYNSSRDRGNKVPCDCQ